MSFLDNVLSGLAYRLKTLSGVVDVSEAPAPEPGQVLTALDATHAEWLDPTGGGGGGGTADQANALTCTGGDPIDVSGAAPPTAGQVLTALDDLNAEWRDPVLPPDIFDTANTVLCALDGDGGLGPVPVFMPPSTALMRADTGDIFAGTGADLAALIGPVSGTDSTARAAAAAAQATADAAVPAALFDANTVIAADVDNTPHAITMPPSTVLVRLASGAIKAGTVAELQALLGIAPAASGSAPLWQQPALPHTDDVEFTSTPTGFDCRVQSTAGASQAMTLGTAAPDAYARLSQGVGNVVFNTQRASWMHLHSWNTNVANNPNPAVYCKPLTAPATNMFVWTRLGVFKPNVGYTGDEVFGICMAADTGGHPNPTLFVSTALGNYAGGCVFQGQSFDGGGTGLTVIPNNASGVTFQSTCAPYEYVAVHKRGTVYHFWLFNDAGQRLHLGSITLATFAPAWFGFQWRCNNGSLVQPGTPVYCADFLRRIDTATFPF
jgi:hypothetical protein